MFSLPSGLLLGVEADLTFPNYLPSNTIVSTLATARSDVDERWTMSAPCAAASATPAGHWLAYATGGFAFAGERFLNTPAGGDATRSISTSARAGPPAPAWNTPSRRTGA